MRCATLLASAAALRLPPLKMKAVQDEVTTTLPSLKPQDEVNRPLLQRMVGKVFPIKSTGIPEEELEAIFYQADSDLSGEIDRKELAEVLFTVGYRIRKDEYDAIFDEIDEDGTGNIDFDEFKLFISKTQRQVFKSQRFAMDLFKRFDVDQGGTIDKFEFAALAEEVEANYKRRTVLTAVAAAAGAFIVGEYDEEYAILQKEFRGLYIEKEAEEAQKRLFPTAMLSSDLDAAVYRQLRKDGFTPANTLFGHSVCSDEVNNKDEQLVDLMVGRWKEGFSLGGLGGLPFAGKSGFRAFLHHAPDDGKLLVLFAPHVGIDAEGRVGALQRDGQSAISKACGAAVGGYKAIQARGNTPAPASAVKDLQDVDNDPFDPELSTIIELLTPRIKGIEGAAEPITFVTYQMYTIVRDLIDNCIRETEDVWEWVDKVAVVGGIMINRRTGGDFFQPLSFEIRTQDAPPKDIFFEAFGEKPNLSPILGSETAARGIFERRLGLNKASDAAIYDRAAEGKLQADRVIRRARKGELVEGKSATCKELDSLIAVDKDALKLSMEEIVQNKIKGQLTKLEKLKTDKNC